MCQPVLSAALLVLVLAVTVYQVDCQDGLNAKDKELTNILDIHNYGRSFHRSASTGRITGRSTYQRGSIRVPPNVEKYSEMFLKKMKTLSCTKNCNFEFDPRWIKTRATVYRDLVNLTSLDGVTLEDNDKNYLEVLKVLMGHFRLYRHEMSPVLLQQAALLASQARPGHRKVNLVKLFPSLYGTALKKKAGSDYQGVFSQSSPVQDPEDKMDFFREDNALHFFHHAWHIQNNVHNPLNRMFNRFYQVHRQMILRYLIERHVLGLPDVVRFSTDVLRRSVHTPFKSYYNADNAVGIRNRQSGIFSPKETCLFSQENVDQLIQKREALARFAAERPRTLEEYAKFVEESLWHGQGHIFISRDCSNDGDVEGASHPMYYSSTSARDPLFYRWHYEIEQSVIDFMDTKSPYTSEDLEPPQGIEMVAVEVRDKCGKTDELATFWEAFNQFGSEYNRVNHEEFSISIRFKNTAASTDKVIIRIFLGLDEFIDSGKWIIEMDKFVHQLTGQPEETIIRSEMDSAITQFSSDLSTGECAWPQNMFIPRGGEGQPTRFRFIVFINGLQNQNVNEGSEPALSNVLCGVRSNRIVNDDRDVVFPFNRKWSGLSYADVLRNHNSKFGQLTTGVGISFKGEGYPGKQCTTTTVTTTNQPEPNTTPSTTTTTTPDFNNSDFEPQMCYDDACYMVSKAAVDWSEGDRLCKRNNMNLAVDIPDILIVGERKKYVNLWNQQRSGRACQYNNAFYQLCSMKEEAFFHIVFRYKAVCEK